MQNSKLPITGGKEKLVYFVHLLKLKTLYILVGHTMKHVKLILFILACFNYSGLLGAADRREYQHGVNFIALPDGRYVLLWSSSPGNPPKGDQKIIAKDGSKCEYYNHDIFYSLVEPNKPLIDAKKLIGLPEAQEPVSAAISRDGVIALTFEDGSDSDIDNCIGIIQQRYQLFDTSLEPISALNTVTTAGAHSGHVAAVGNYFVVTYAEGWLEDDTLGETGSGNDIYVDVIDVHGESIWHKGIAVDNGTARDWWPLIAGSDNRAMLVWQRSLEGGADANLMFTIYDPHSNSLSKETSLLKSKIVNYQYDVQYLQSIKRFLIVGNFVGNSLLRKIGSIFTVFSPKTFAYLIDNTGKIIDQWDMSSDSLNCASYLSHTIVRESQPAILEGDDLVKVLYPVKPKGILMLGISPAKIEKCDYIDGDHYWFPLGTDGVFIDEGTAYFANLTPLGLKTTTFKIK